MESQVLAASLDPESYLSSSKVRGSKEEGGKRSGKSGFPTKYGRGNLERVKERAGATCFFFGHGSSFEHYYDGGLNIIMRFFATL